MGVQHGDERDRLLSLLGPLSLSLRFTALVMGEDLLNFGKVCSD